jgi:hypothetical protein
MALGIIPFVGKGHADARQDGPGGHEQPLEQQGIRVSLTLAAVARQATGTPSPVIATWHWCPACRVGLEDKLTPPKLR